MPESPTPDEDPILIDLMDREVVTNVIDYNLKSLLDLITTENLNLQPFYQRRHRWSVGVKSRLIESFLLNVPVPPVFFSENRDGTYWVIDGQQRLSTLREFVDNELVLKDLEVLQNFNDLKFSDFTPGVKNRLLYRIQLRAIVILKSPDESIALDVFQRLNTGAAPLGKQEFRNSAFPGPLNARLIDLAEEEEFAKLIETHSTKERKGSRYLKMEDVEWVLRFFTFCDSWQSFSKLMSYHLDEFMLKNREMSIEDIERLSADFRKAVKVVVAAFGKEAAFKRWDVKKEKFLGIRSPLYDAQILAAQYFSPEQFEDRKPAVLEEYKRLFDDAGFVEDVTKGINAPRALANRVLMVKNALEAAIREKG